MRSGRPNRRARAWSSVSTVLWNARTWTGSRRAGVWWSVTQGVVTVRKDQALVTSLRHQWNRARTTAVHRPATPTHPAANGGDRRGRTATRNPAARSSRQRGSQSERRERLTGAVTEAELR